MDEAKVPDFLLKNVHGSADDRKKLLTDLQTYLLWRHVEGDAPFDREAALRLQTQLRTQLEHRSRIEAEKLRKAKEKTHLKLESACRQIAEHIFQVEVLGDEKEITTGVVKWDGNITDRKTGKLVGTPRQIFQSVHLKWFFTHDPRQNLTGFLGDAKRRFDNFQYDFSIDRNLSGEHTLEEPKPKKYCSFTLRLKWNPFSESEIEKKFRKILRSHA